MAQKDWSLEQDGDGVVIRFADGEVRSLGPRDEAFIRFADFMAEDYVSAIEEPGPK